MPDGNCKKPASGKDPVVCQTLYAHHHDSSAVTVSTAGKGLLHPSVLLCGIHSDVTQPAAAAYFIYESEKHSGQPPASVVPGK